MKKQNRGLSLSIQNKEQLISCGFLRSGNTFLNRALNLLYFPELEVNLRHHTVKSIEKYDKLLSVLRSPLDCLASRQIAVNQEYSIEMDIKFYLRFHNAILENKSKIVIMKFEQFTTDIDYIKTQVLENFQIKPQNEVSIEEIKNSMLNHDESYFLPRNNKDELDRVKGEILASPYFDECLELYAQLKE